MSKLALVLMTLTTLAVWTTASSALILKDIAWENINGDVEVTVVFINDDEVDSDPITGMIDARTLGAFLPSEGTVCNFGIDSLPPGGTAEVICNATEGENLPFGAGTIDPTTPGKLAEPLGPGDCEEPDFWNGSFVVSTSEGDVYDFHRAEVPVCFEFGYSYVEVSILCDEGATWAFSGVCPGWSAELLDIGFSPAPNPLPGGVFFGWIALAPPNVLSGSCEPVLEVSCGTDTQDISVLCPVCNCTGTVPVEPATWGQIKAHHR